MCRSEIEINEIRNSAIRLREKLELIQSVTAREFLEGDLGKVIGFAVQSNLEMISEIPGFELFAHGIFPEAEDEYMNFYSWFSYGKPAYSEQS